MGLTANEIVDRLAIVGNQAHETQYLVTYREVKILLHSRFKGDWKKDNGVQ